MARADPFYWQEPFALSPYPAEMDGPKINVLGISTIPKPLLRRDTQLLPDNFPVERDPVLKWYLRHLCIADSNPFSNVIIT